MVNSIGYNPYSFQSRYLIPFQGADSASVQNYNAAQYTASSNIQTPVNTSIPNDIVEISDGNKINETSNQEKKKSGLSTAEKAALWIGIPSLIGLGAWIISKGKVKPKALTEKQAKELEQLVSSGKIDKQYAEIFKNMNGLDIDQWLGKTYGKLCDDMGYRFNYDIPEIKISTLHSTGGSSSINTITLNMQGGKTTQAQILGTLRHELEHFRQKDLVFRAFGQDEYINAELQPILKRLKYNEAHCIEQTGKKYSELTQAEIDKYVERHKDMLIKDCSKLRSLLERKGKIGVGTSEYKEAERYLNAMKNYEDLSMYENNLTAESIKEMRNRNPERVKFLQDVYKRYNDNELEVCARREGEKIEKMYELFESIL